MYMYVNKSFNKFWLWYILLWEGGDEFVKIFYLFIYFYRLISKGVLNFGFNNCRK